MPSSRERGAPGWGCASGSCCLRRDAAAAEAPPTPSKGSGDAAHSERWQRLSDEELLEEVLRFAATHKLMLAGRALECLEKRGWQPCAGSLPSRLDGIRTQASRIAEVRRSLSSDEGWRLQRQHEGMRTLFQEHPSGFVRVRIEATIDAPIFDILALLYEVGFWHSWMPSVLGLGLTEASKVGEASLMNLCFHILVAMPWPLRARSCTFAVDCVDCMDPEDDPQQIVVLLDSKRAPGNLPAGALGPPERPGAIAMEMWDSGFLLTPADVAGTPHSFVQLSLVIDPKMRVPPWLLNMALRNLAFLIMLELRKAVRLTRTERYLSLTTDPRHPMYSYVRRRMAEDLPLELAKAPPVRGNARESAKAAIPPKPGRPESLPRLKAAAAPQAAAKGPPTLSLALHPALALCFLALLCWLLWRP